MQPHKFNDCITGLLRRKTDGLILRKTSKQVRQNRFSDPVDVPCFKDLLGNVYYLSINEIDNDYDPCDVAGNIDTRTFQDVWGVKDLIDLEKKIRDIAAISPELVSGVK